MIQHKKERFKAHFTSDYIISRIRLFLRSADQLSFLSPTYLLLKHHHWKQNKYMILSLVTWFNRQMNQIFTNSDHLKCLTITLVMQKVRADILQIAVPINGLRVVFQSFLYIWTTFLKFKKGAFVAMILLGQPNNHVEPHPYPLH